MAKKVKHPEGEGVAASRVAFVGTATRLVTFSELNVDPTKVQPLTPGQSKNVQLQLAVTIAHQEISDAKLAEVTLDLTLTPDPTHQPYRIQVVMSGLFRAPSDVDPAQFESFCKRAAPVIMWPYIRTLVSTVTADARYGVVRLNPVNLTSLIKEEGWKTE